jgi:hypothetical protein
MADYRFAREARTPYSEVYAIDDGQHSLGRVDVHYTASAAHATLIVHHSLSEELVQDLLEAIDDQIVTSADPYREDLVVTVWRGEEVGVFADESALDDEDEEDEEDGDDEEPADETVEVTAGGRD